MRKIAGGVLSKIERGFDLAARHYLVTLLTLALIVMTLLGVGNYVIVAVVGIVLCAAGFRRGGARVDIWVLIPLLVYWLMSAASSYAAYGNILRGFAPSHAIFPVLYLVMAHLEEDELRLLRRLCALWAGCVSVMALTEFVRKALEGSAARLGGVYGNPNALGSFLVLGWFAWMTCMEEKEPLGGPTLRLARRMEPLILAALALTLSMGNFLSMAVGVLVLLVMKKRENTWRETFHYICRLLARASIGVGTGLLLYMTARNTEIPWFCVVLAVYLLVLAFFWEKLVRFLAVYPWAAMVLAGSGVLVAGAAVILRPSSFATFAERLGMMRNGLFYITQKPILGLGPMQWREVNMLDGDKYYNTWYIHNVLIHLGVEVGLIAMEALVLIIIRQYVKKSEPGRKGGFTAFCLYNLMDTSFFYVGISSMMILSTANPRGQGRQVPAIITRLIFILFAGIFAHSIYRVILA